MNARRAVAELVAELRTRVVALEETRGRGAAETARAFGLLSLAAAALELAEAHERAAVDALAEAIDHAIEARGTVTRWAELVDVAARQLGQAMDARHPPRALVERFDFTGAPRLELEPQRETVAERRARELGDDDDDPEF